MENKISKIKMASEVLAAMEFLGIPAENFRAMRIEAGSLEALHGKMAEALGA